jgi:hypothetical protein
MPEPGFISPFGEPGSRAERRFACLIRALRDRLRSYPRRPLADEVAGLSEALSKHRGRTVAEDYLRSDLTRAAYCAHFLPWNVARLMLVWAQSPPTERIAAQPKAAADAKADNAGSAQTPRSFIVEDWGAGPLTGLLALWVAGYTDNRPVICHNVERNPMILNWGEHLLKEAIAADGVAQNITVRRHTRPLDITADAEALGDSGGSGESDRDGESRTRRGVDLLLVANAYNEWLPVRGRSDAPARAFGRLAARTLAPGGTLCVMEPASRVVSWGVMTLREVLVAPGSGFAVTGPCTHAAKCPLLSPKLKTWCHFRRSVITPREHAGLVEAVGGGRREISFSYLSARRTKGEARTAEPAAETATSRHLARVLSDPVEVEDGRAVYACAAEGRIQLETKSVGWGNALRAALAQGEVISYRASGTPRTDTVTHARKIWVSDCRKPEGGLLST